MATYLVGVGAVLAYSPSWALALAAAVASAVAWGIEVSSGPSRAEAIGRAPGTLELGEGSLVVRFADRSETFRRDEIESGFVEEPDWVVLNARDGRVVSARLPGHDARSALLRHLGVAASDRVLSFPIYSRAGSVSGGELMGVLALIGLFPFTLLACSGFSLTAWALCMGGSVTLGAYAVLGVFGLVAALAYLASRAVYGALRRRQVVIGTDGLRIEGWRARFVPFSAVAGADVDARGVLLELKNGKTLHLPTGRSDGMFPTEQTGEEAARARLLLARIEDALSALGTGRALDQKAAWLENAGRDLEDWQKNLAALGAETGNYRRPGISDAELVEIVRDGGRTREQRSAAAFVLGQRRVELATVEAARSASADPDLAQALERAYAGTLELPPRLRLEEAAPRAEEAPASAMVDESVDDGPTRRQRAP